MRREIEERALVLLAPAPISKRDLSNAKAQEVTDELRLRGTRETQRAATEILDDLENTTLVLELGVETGSVPGVVELAGVQRAAEIAEIAHRRIRGVLGGELDRRYRETLARFQRASGRIRIPYENRRPLFDAYERILDREINVRYHPTPQAWIKDLIGVPARRGESIRERGR